ncbi:MAG TPA: methyltransferase domain-containing protein [Xanthomonadales bacterium]|nr:methyltransferase domain-containing protein [Xanthomonadales bacterium]
MTQATPERITLASSVSAEWWERADRHYAADGQLWFAGRQVSAMAAEFGTPSYVYCAARVTHNVARLRTALGRIGVPTRLLYAMKSNRHAPLLAHLLRLGVGVDVASPGEVRHALACGFDPSQLSFTAGCLSSADYAALAAWPQLWINADSLTALRRIGALSPRRQIGLRINPASALGYNDLVSYSGPKPSKFGVYRDRFEEALMLARESGLDLLGLHCHAGCGFLTPQLPALDRVYTRIGEFLDAAPQINRLNLGGGLGIPLVAGDDELDLNAWADLVHQHFGRRSLHLTVEPGDYLVKDAGALLTEVTQVEEKGGRIFVGVNAGFNVHPEPAFYKLPLIAAPVQRSSTARQRVSIAGNINEALDLFAEDVALPAVREGDVLCFLNAGGYGASMSSQHCLRTEMSEHLIPIASAVADVDLEQLADANKQAWDRLYAGTGESVWGEQPLPFLEQFSDFFASALQPPSRLLDAGAGEGRNLPFLLALGADEVHALDSSNYALDKIPPDLRAQVLTRAGDLAATGYPGACFDGITLLDVFETLPNAEAVLAELYHVLKPGGLLLCNIPGFDDGVAGLDMHALSDDAFLYQSSYFYRFVEADAAEAMMTAAGFEILHSGRREWIEEAHPGYRSGAHQHVSHVLLVRRPPARHD